MKGFVEFLKKNFVNDTLNTTLPKKTFLNKQNQQTQLFDYQIVVI